MVRRIENWMHVQTAIPGVVVIVGSIFEPTSQKRESLLLTCCVSLFCPGNLMVIRDTHLVCQVQKGLQHLSPGVRAPKFFHPRQSTFTRGLCRDRTIFSNA